MELEVLLNEIVCELFKMKLPIVLKGAIGLHLYLSKKNYNKIYRMTHDIDLSWTGSTTSMPELEKYIKLAVSRVDNSLSIKIKRDFSPDGTMSAGFNIIDKNLEKVTSIDVEVKYKPVPFIVLDYKGISVSVTSPLKMLVDKLSVISCNKVFRRIKDLLDIYILISQERYQSLDILELTRSSDKSIGDFATLVNRKDEIRHAYDKLKGVNNKPQFENLYEDILTFIAPFRTESYKKIPLVWTGSWHQQIKS